MKGHGLIEVRQTGADDPMRFKVAITDARSTSHYEVMISVSDYERLARGSTPDSLIEAAFRFLLDREPKESIMGRFEVKVIGTYFPEFEQKLPEYLR